MNIEPPKPSPVISLLLWISGLFLLLMCCICGAVIKGWI